MFCTVKSFSSSPIDELEDFARGNVQNNSNEGKVNASTRTANRNSKDAHAAAVNNQKTVDDLDSFFNVGFRSKSVPRSRTATVVRAIVSFNHHQILYKGKKNESLLQLQLQQYYACFFVSLTTG